MINNFSGEYAFLRDDFLVPVWYEGIWYPSAEHAYQASRTLYPKQKMLILECKTAIEAIRISNSKAITFRAGWKELRFQTKKVIVKSKFKNKELAKKLVDTFPHQLINENMYHDNYWGNCKCKNCFNTRGKNKSGNILIAVRDVLRFHNGIPNKRIVKNESFAYY